MSTHLRLATLVFVGVLVVAPLSSSSAQTTLPNVVVLITDDQDVDSLPVMRNLMSYPDGSWVRFTNAFVNDSICCPAQASLLTGQYARTHGVIKNDLGDRLNDANTLPVWLDQAGYRTGLIGKYLNRFPWNRGRSYVPPGWDVFKWTGIGKADARTTLAVDFINTATSPFFVYLAYSEPHAPTQPPARYANADVYTPPDGRTSTKGTSPTSRNGFGTSSPCPRRRSTSGAWSALPHSARCWQSTTASSGSWTR